MLQGFFFVSTYTNWTKPLSLLSFFRRQIGSSKAGAVRFSSTCRPIRRPIGAAHAESNRASLGATAAGKARAPGDAEWTLPGSVIDGQC